MNIVITGGARGIGFELARQAAARGDKVICGVRSPESASDLRAIVHDVLPLDVTSDESVRAFADALRTRFDHVDVLINNAGVYRDPQNSGLEQLTSEILLSTLEANTLGPIRVTQALLPFLRAASSPKIATVSSLMGSLADNQSGGAYAYRLSKAAVNMFMKTLAVDESSFTVLTLHPGWVKTKMGGAGAPLEASKSAEGLWTVIQSATSNDSGKFFNHAGRELPW